MVESTRGNGELLPAAPGSPLVVIPYPSGDHTLVPGEVFELRVTLSNQGKHSAIIDLFIDDTSQPLRQWCTAPQERLALSSQQSSEVVFRFPIPLEAIPGAYPYCLVIDAPAHYPEATPIRHQAQLYVIPAAETAVRVNDPTFLLLPATSATQPAALQPGQTLDVRAWVENRSPRVDRFRLSCPDLPADWYTIRYPDNPSDRGLVRNNNSLALNPQSSGEILLRLHPPADTPAGNYFPSVRLTSENIPDLVLLEVVSLQVLPTYQINLELQTVLGKVRRQAGIFHLLLNNPGNTRRELIVRAKDRAEDKLCTYQLSPEQLQLSPHSQARVELLVRPAKWWRQPFFGGGMPLNFYLQVEDVHQLPLPNRALEGTLLWEARPWWHLWVLVLSAAGAIATLVFLIWWFFFKPPSPPRILEFSSASSIYAEADGEAVHLNWRITQAKYISAIKIVGLGADGKVLSSPVSYSLSRGLPKELQPFCVLEKVLSCRNVPTDARQAGDYRFTLTVTPQIRRAAPATSQTPPIKIESRPLAQIARFSVNLLPAPEKPAQPETKAIALLTPPSQTFGLSWTIDQPATLAQLTMIGRSPEGEVLSPAKTYTLKDNQLPKALSPYCQLTDAALTCDKVPLPVPQPGNYRFELSLQGAKSDQVLDTQPADLVKVPIPPPPKILDFAASQSQISATAPEPIRLSWQISNPSQLQEIRLVGRSPEGAVNVPAQKIPLRNGLPPTWEKFCTLTATDLRCQNLPTAAKEAGNYIFELTAIAKTPTPENTNPASDSRKTDLIQIQAPDIPLKILAFTVDGQPAPPKLVIDGDANQRPAALAIAWQVTGGPNLSVELLPSPGKVEPTGQLTYPLGNFPGQETLTLQVTDGSGKQIRRSLILQTTPLPPANPQLPTPNSRPPSSKPQPLTPTELPPKFD